MPLLCNLLTPNSSTRCIQNKQPITRCDKFDNSYVALTANHSYGKSREKERERESEREPKKFSVSLLCVSSPLRKEADCDMPRQAYHHLSFEVMLHAHSATKGNCDATCAL